MLILWFILQYFHCLSLFSLARHFCTLHLHCTPVLNQAWVAVIPRCQAVAVGCLPWVRATLASHPQIPHIQNLSPSSGPVTLKNLRPTCLCITVCLSQITWIQANTNLAATRQQLEKPSIPLKTVHYQHIHHHDEPPTPLKLDLGQRCISEKGF